VPVRQLYVDGVRFFRTQTDSSEIGFPKDARITTTGFETTLPVTWNDPTTVELVSDHTWVQHRCPVVSAALLPVPQPPPPSPPGPHATCHWGNKTDGRSPGTSLKQLTARTYEDCQQYCCDALPACKAIIFSGNQCFVLGRKFEPNFSPTAGVFVADLNCTGAAASCEPAPPPPVYRTNLTISEPCFVRASRPGALGLSTATVAFFENTGVFTAYGQFYVNLT